MAPTLICVFNVGFTVVIDVLLEYHHETGNCCPFQNLEDPAVVDAGAGTRKVIKKDAGIVPFACPVCQGCISCPSGNMLSVICSPLLPL